MEGFFWQALAVLAVLLPVVVWITIARFSPREHGYREADKHKEYVRDYLGIYFPMPSDLDPEELALLEPPKELGVFRVARRWLNGLFGRYRYNVTVVFYSGQGYPLVHLFSVWAKAVNEAAEKFCLNYFGLENTTTDERDSNSTVNATGYTQLLMSRDDKAIGFLRFER